MDTTSIVSSMGSQIGDYFGVAVGLGLVVVGAGIGIGMIGGKALEAMARQPDMKSELRTMMILAAALVEGVAFFAAVVCLLILLTK